MDKNKPVKFQKPIKYIDDSKHGLVFRVPANDAGFKFVKDFRKYLNTHNYDFSFRYTGKRVPSNAGHTLKENATSIRGYVKAKRKPKTKSFKNARFAECLVEDTSYHKQIEDIALNKYYGSFKENLTFPDEEKKRLSDEVEWTKANTEPYYYSNILQDKLDVILAIAKDYKNQNTPY